MTRQSQKEEEEAYLKKAMTLLDIDYNIISREQEPPDFVTQIGNNKVGIEITKLYKNLDDAGNSAKQEQLLTELTEKAIQIFKEKGGPNLCFSIGYNGNKYIRNNKEFVERLADFLLTYCHAEENQEKTFPHAIPSDDFQELTVIENIYVGTSLTNEPSGFSVSTFSSTVVESSRIDKLIEKKSSDIERYCLHPDFKCRYKWLVIVLPAMIMAADLRLPEFAFTDITHGFDHIYILDAYRNEIIEV